MHTQVRPPAGPPRPHTTTYLVTLGCCGAAPTLSLTSMTVALPLHKVHSQNGDALVHARCRPAYPRLNHTICSKRHNTLTTNLRELCRDIDEGSHDYYAPARGTSKPYCTVGYSKQMSLCVPCYCPVCICEGGKKCARVLKRHTDSQGRRHRVSRDSGKHVLSILFFLLFFFN